MPALRVQSPVSTEVARQMGHHCMQCGQSKELRKSQMEGMQCDPDSCHTPWYDKKDRTTEIQTYVRFGLVKLRMNVWASRFHGPSDVSKGSTQTGEEEGGYTHAHTHTHTPNPKP